MSSTNFDEKSSFNSAGRLLRRGRTVLRPRKRSEVHPTEQRRHFLLRKISTAPSRDLRPELTHHHRPSHHTARGRFINPWPSARTRSLSRPRLTTGTGRTLFFTKQPRTVAPSDEVLAALLLLADKPDFELASKTFERDPRACVHWWLGHCTWLLRFRRFTVLTDPVWTGRLESGSKRLVPPVCAVEDLPPIDVVLLSSANPDHFDRTACAKLASRVKRWLVPLGVAAPLIDAGVPAECVTALDWWEEIPVGNARVACTPAQHSSTVDGALWCSYVIKAPGHTLFYCGGTGYRAVNRGIDDFASYEHRRTYGGVGCPIFREVARRYGRLDTALLPVGQYKPRATMAATQGDPIDMLFVHRDLRVRKSIAHRWGTFAASEDMLDPVRMLESAIAESPVSEHDFIYVRHGKMHVS